MTLAARFRHSACGNGRDDAAAPHRNGIRVIKYKSPIEALRKLTQGSGGMVYGPDLGKCQWYARMNGMWFGAQRFGPDKEQNRLSALIAILDRLWESSHGERQSNQYIEFIDEESWDGKLIDGDDRPRKKRKND